jgi:hypothetical protein
MLLQRGDMQTLGGGPGQRLRFGGLRLDDGTWIGVTQLWLDDQIAFKLTPGCNTCQFLFERAEGAGATVSLAELTDRLTNGVEGLEQDVIERFGELLPQGRYLPMLLSIEPRLVYPGKPGDYFCEEQVDVWGVDSYWGLPEYPRTPYYRTFETAIDGGARFAVAESMLGRYGAHLFEFMVPMVPPYYNDPVRVGEYRELLRATSLPTVVALSILEVRLPALKNGALYYEHWGLAHFVLDGHHKLQAAAEAGRALQLLSLLSIENSYPEEATDAVPLIRTQRAAPAPLPSTRAQQA